MGINTNSNNGNAINVSFNAILGCMFLGSDATAVNAEIGKAPKGQSFSGNSGFTAEARKNLKAQGVTLLDGGNVSGILRDAKLRVVESAGKNYPYLNVRLQDGSDTIFISLGLGTSGAQVLARKLLNAEPNVETQISVFSTLNKREGQDVAYAETNASLKQNGVEVKAKPAVESFVPSVNEAIEKLKAAGVDDKTILNQKRRSVATQWHVELLENQVGPKFAAAKPANAAAEQHDEPAAAAPAPAATGSGFDDFEDDIPF